MGFAFILVIQMDQLLQFRLTDSKLGFMLVVYGITSVAVGERVHAF